MVLNPAVIFAAFAIGAVTGLRSFTGPAVVAWAAHLGWLDLKNSRLAFMASTPATIAASLLALAELVADKLPFIPKRTSTGPLVARIFFGAIVGAAFCIAKDQPLTEGAISGALGGVAGAFAGYEIRRRLVQNLSTPDFVIALAEDVLAVGGGFLLAYRL